MNKVRSRFASRRQAKEWVLDWNALGTWAAVVVALGIALKDTFHRWRERTARHLLVAASIFLQVTQTQLALRETLEQANAALAEQDSPADALRAACDDFLDVATHYGLQDLRGTADQFDALPEHVLIPLAKAITLLNMLAYNGHADRVRGHTATTEAMRSELRHWCAQVRSVLTSLEWVERGIQAKLRTRRWTNPEQLGW